MALTSRKLEVPAAEIAAAVVERILTRSVVNSTTIGMMKSSMSRRYLLYNNIIILVKDNKRPIYFLII